MAKFSSRESRRVVLVAIVSLAFPGDCDSEVPSEDQMKSARVLAVSIRSHVLWILENIEKPSWIKKSPLINEARFSWTGEGSRPTSRRPTSRRPTTRKKVTKKPTGKKTNPPKGSYQQSRDFSPVDYDYDADD